MAKRKFQPAIVMLIVTVLALGALLSGCGNKSGGELDGKKIYESLVPNPQAVFTGDKQVSENTDYRLYVDGKSGLVRIVSKSSGKQWSSVPENLEGVMKSSLPFLNTPVVISYTQGSGMSQTYPAKEEGSLLTTEAITNGARLHVDMPTLGLKFAVDYTLAANGLNVSIPFQSIVETGKSRIMEIEVLPFFEAATRAENGAIFTPDGSGAIMKFKQNGPLFLFPYTGYVYGGDHSLLTKVYEQVTKNKNEIVSTSPQQSIAMPVFGLYRDDKAYLAVVAKGQYDAQITASPAGIRNIPFYRTSVQFIYRNGDVVFFDETGEIPLVQKEMMEGDREVRYILIDKDNPNYVDLAQAYRKYLVEERGVTPVAGQGAPFELQLLGGVQRDKAIGSSFVNMTTFAQAKELLDILSHKGVAAVELLYKGWSKGGLFGKQPAHLPADRSLGGNAELKSLAEYAKQNDVRLYLQTNYVMPYKNNTVANNSSEAIRGLNKEAIQKQDSLLPTRQPNFYGKKYHLLNPEKAYNRYIAPELKELSELGIDGVSMAYMGDMLYSDHDDKKPATREQSAVVWLQALDEIRKAAGASAVDYGFDYTFGHIDRIDNAPMDSSRFTLFDEAVPFYQIAVHGLIPYTSAPANLRDDHRYGFLKSLEYGALPSYLLTYEDPSHLKSSLYEELYSSRFADWVDTAVKEYEAAAEVLGPVANEAIIGHARLADQLYSTTFDGGTRIVVNYGDKPAGVEGIVIEAHDYHVFERSETP